MLHPGVILITLIKKGPNPDVVSPLDVRATLPLLYLLCVAPMPGRAGPGLPHHFVTALGEGNKMGPVRNHSIDSFNHPA